VVRSFSGVRALYDDGSDRPEDVTRDYELFLDTRDGKAQTAEIKIPKKLKTTNL